MDKFYSTQKYQDIKFSPLNQNVLGVFSNRDIQTYRVDSVPAKLRQVVEIGQVTTFEWQKCQMKHAMYNQCLRNQYILAAHQNGKISLINAAGQNPMDRKKGKLVEPVSAAKIEKVFVTSSMV